MGKSGDLLGADLGELWYAGKRELPRVADDYGDARSNVPPSVSHLCARGGGLGSNPGAHLDAMIGRVRKFLQDTETALDEVGEALVWIADEYAATDETCRTAFERKKAALEGAEG